MKKNKQSINPFNNKKYIIPNVLNDKSNIDSFLNSHPNKKIIVVQGLGFVGAVMSLVCANSEKEDYVVIGVDIANENNYWKIRSINEGVFPVIASDPKIEMYFNKTKEKKNFYATYDSYVYSKADYIIVDINLDVDKKSNFKGDLLDYKVDLSNFKNAIKEIGKNCKNDVLILVETTVPPGTCKKLIKPIISKCLKNRKLDSNKFKLGHSYERVMPGPNYIDSIKNFYRVFSGINKESADATEGFLKTLISTSKYPLTRLSNTNATELSKVLENSYRAMNISFITEWSRFSEQSDVNLYEVVDAIRMRPTHSNLMYPGIGVGGYCLTKDPLLASWSKVNHFNSKKNLKQSENGVKTNDKMPLFAFNYMKRSFELKTLKNLKILLMGVSYRSNVADTRYSPVERFYKFCLSDGAKINLHDPYVTYWEELNLSVRQDFDILDFEIDILVISTLHEEYKKSNLFFKKILNKEKMMIFDSVGLFSENEIKKLSKVHTLKILGRGDI